MGDKPHSAEKPGALFSFNSSLAVTFQGSLPTARRFYFGPKSPAKCRTGSPAVNALRRMLYSVMFRQCKAVIRSLKARLLPVSPQVPETGALTHPPYRPDIDGLRAIAVLSVIGFHAFPDWVKSGFTGVDIFFVISGFLISTILFGSLEKNKFSFKEFYARRIRRIFPALIAVLAACLVLGGLVLLADEYKQLGKHIAGGAAFISNFLFWNESGYFDNAAETKPLLHLWSLGIEEQFYIFYPLALWIAWKRRFNLLAATVIIALVSFGANIYQHKTNPFADFYSPLDRFWELMAGSILAYMELHGRQTSHHARITGGPPKASFHLTTADLRAILGVILLGAGFMVITRETAFPGWLALFPVLGAAFLISAGRQAWFNRTVLSVRFLVWFGLISYPLYLWHWVLLSFARILEGQTPSREIRTAAVLVSVVLAWLTYRWAEKPFRFGPLGKIKIIFLLVLMAVIGCLGYNVYAHHGFLLRPLQRNTGEIFDYKRQWDGWQKCGIVTAAKPREGGCKTLKNTGSFEVVVIGDSHAGHLAAGLKQYFGNRKENVAILFHAGCYPSLPVSVDGTDYYKCGGLIEKAFQFSLNNEQTKLILVSGYAAVQIQKNRYFEAQTLGESEVRKNLAAFDAGMNKTLSKLAKSGKKIIYLIDNPELRNDPRACVDRGLPWIKPDCPVDISRKDVLARNGPYYAVMEKYKRLYPEIQFVSMADALCDTSTCHGVDDGQLLYATRDHLSPYGSRHVVQKIRENLDRALK